MRAYLLKKIRGTIQKSNYFKLEDFKIDEDANSISISYRFETKYSFYATITEVNKIACLLVPGRLASKDSLSATGETGLLQALVSWMDNLSDELSTDPLVREIKEQEQEVENIIKQVEQFPNEYFTRQEAEDLQIRLSEKIAQIEKSVQVTIDEDSDIANALKEELKKLKQDIETLKKQVPTLTKKGWAGSFLTRYRSWSPQLVSLAGLKSGGSSNYRYAD